ncbi:excisionase family DNA-binding protein [Variovorax sp. 38R]|uniref:excisionase family DNA-binding protein n=1 Tax=Variovorax sp. 38R TaxID=2774875 RepID=UPI00177EE3A6|nr:excisionase family DNA-binding protein [Variovorax sp. 38R]QOF77567.1 excisionase family DNA-binding protein [Variovorax sp. 38R]
MNSKPLTTMSSLRQLAARLNISLGTARKLVDDGHLTAIRVGTRCVRISDTEIESFLAKQKTCGARKEAAL